MKKYKVKCVVEVETEAEDEENALDKACVIADWANGDWQVEEIKEERGKHDRLSKSLGA